MDESLRSRLISLIDLTNLNEDATSYSIAPSVLLANDTDPDTGETATLKILSVGGKDGSSGNETFTTSKGATVTLTQTSGVVSAIAYDATTSSTLNALAVGSTTTDTFNYIIKDAQGATSTSELF